MIVDRPESHFVFCYHPEVVLLERSYLTYKGRALTNAEVLLYWGKWVVLGTAARIGELARELDLYVEDGSIPCIKYDRQPSRNLGVEEHVLMVYCDRRQRQDTWDILARHGVRLKAWVTERETLALWSAGGPLLERWIQWKAFDAEAAAAARADARTRMAKIFDYPEVPYQPWEQ